MFFLPKCYKRLKQESSLLRNSGWCEENLKKKTDSFLPIYKRKKEKKLFFSSLSLTSFHQTHLKPPNISCSWKHWLIKSILKKIYTASHEELKISISEKKLWKIKNNYPISWIEVGCSLGPSGTCRGSSRNRKFYAENLKSACLELWP